MICAFEWRFWNIFCEWLNNVDSSSIVIFNGTLICLSHVDVKE